MKNAKEQRDEWQELLSSGEIPEDVQHSIDLYKKMRDDPCWRASSFLERLGEAALAFEKIIKSSN